MRAASFSWRSDKQACNPVSLPHPFLGRGLSFLSAPGPYSELAFNPAQLLSSATPLEVQEAGDRVLPNPV